MSKKLLNPTIEYLFQVFENAGWYKTLENGWIVFTAPPDDEGDSEFNVVYPDRAFAYEWEKEQYRRIFEELADDLGYISLAKPDRYGWYKVAEVELEDRQYYLVYCDLDGSQALVRYRAAYDIITVAPQKGKPWWDMGYSDHKFLFNEFLYFRPLPHRPEDVKVPDWKPQ